MTGHKILNAARTLLMERGYAGITYTNVARAAGVDKGTISYNFGNKAGLLAAVVDSLIHEECMSLLDGTSKYTGQDRVHYVIEGFKRITLAADAQRGWFDVLPHAFRDPELRERICALYAWWFSLNLEGLGIDAAASQRPALAQGLAAVVAATTDGLAIQVGLGAQRDLTAAMEALEIMVKAVLDQLEPDLLHVQQERDVGR